MFPTAEVRWFHRGAIPPEALAWFQRAACEPEEEPSRTDHYLRFDSDALGIKLRQGRIEIKQRQHIHGTVRFHERVSGVVERWCKWSFPLAEADSTLQLPPSPAWAWIGVQKQRNLQRYQAADDGGITALAAGEYPEQGCSLELASITHGGTDWWSLAFEAFGEESSLQENLLLVARHVLKGRRPPPLMAADCFGYPGWLQMVDR